MKPYRVSTLTALTIALAGCATGPLVMDPTAVSMDNSPLASLKPLSNVGLDDALENLRETSTPRGEMVSESGKAMKTVFVGDSEAPAQLTYVSSNFGFANVQTGPFTAAANYSYRLSVMLHFEDETDVLTASAQNQDWKYDRGYRQVIETVVADVYRQVEALIH